VNVTASRAGREARTIPLHVETIPGDVVAGAIPRSTGDALANIANITQVGDGPFGIRPRLRGLDSTRVLVLVDGVRLNTARQATERAGAEVGLVSLDDISRLEIVNGAGTLLYGSDALAGTINITTNEPVFSSARRFTYGFTGFYSSNDDGRRGTLSFGVTAPKYAVQVRGGAERFSNYHAGAFNTEDVNPLFASGQLHNVDTIDDNFGFSFKSFPDPFNAPFVRTDSEIPNSQAKGNFLSVSSLFATGGHSTLKVRYFGRRMQDVGFPDFSQPYFFNATSLPDNQLDRMSARFETPAPVRGIANLSVTAYYQRTDRLLRNLLPVQFPVPTAGSFFPISVMRLDIQSETEQRVWTPGLDVQAVMTPASNHLVTAGLTMYRDRSSDARTTSTSMSMIGQVRWASVDLRQRCFRRPCRSDRRQSRIRYACLTRACATSACSSRTNGTAARDVDRRRYSWRFLPSRYGTDARVRRGIRRGWRDARDRSGDAAGSCGRNLPEAGVDR
jgi:outer membrane receptor protein involved in Fe transport